MPPDQQTQEILRKLAEASLAKQGGKEVIETSRPTFSQTGRDDVKFRSDPSQLPQEPPVDYAALNNPDLSKTPNDSMQKFADKVKEQNNSRKPASEGSLQVIVNPAEKEFNDKRSGEKVSKIIEYMNQLPDNIRTRGEVLDHIMEQPGITDDEINQLNAFAEKDYNRLSGKTITHDEEE